MKCGIQNACFVNEMFEDMKKDQKPSTEGEGQTNNDIYKTLHRQLNIVFFILKLNI